MTIQHFTSDDTVTWFRLDRMGSEQHFGNLTGTRAGNVMRLTVFAGPHRYDLALEYDEVSETFKTTTPELESIVLELAYYTSGDEKAFLYGNWKEEGLNYSFYAPLFLTEATPGTL